MKILPVCQNNVQNFRGLWGERSPKTKELKYYPFSDETPEQISKNTGAYKNLVAIMATLPFTAKEFLKYTKNRMSILRQKLIEKHIVNKGLSVVIK